MLDIVLGCLLCLHKIRKTVSPIFLSIYRSKQAESQILKSNVGIINRVYLRSQASSAS